MIYFNINIRNPWWWDRWNNIKCWSGPTFLKNKYWEVQLMKCEELFRIEFNWTIRQDHAGIELELGLLGYKISCNIYDCRHWDHVKGTWQEIDEEPSEFKHDFVGVKK